jgi:spore germination protein Q
MYNNQMHWPTHAAAAGPAMVSPAMQGPGMGPMPNTGYSGAMAGGGYPSAMAGGGYPSAMAGGGYPGAMTGGGYPSTKSGGGYPGAMTGGGYPGAMTGGGYPGAMTGGGYPGYMTGVGGASTMIPGAAPPPVPSGAHILPDGTPLPPSQEESYVENILRMNLGKVATIYMTFENNSEWNAKIFKGLLEAAGRDHIIISDPTTGRRYLLLMVNLDYITFDEPVTYTLPFGSAGGGPTRSP